MSENGNVAVEEVKKTTKPRITKALKNAIIIRQNLNRGTRHYIYSSDVRETYKKEYNYVQQDVKLLRFAQDIVGAISDCYILYAVSVMGVADMDSLRLFLKALSNSDKNLSIADPDNKELLKRRVKTLVTNGFLFKHRYEVDTFDANNEPIVNRVSLYSIDKSAQSFMNQKLAKRIAVNEWFSAKPLKELIGWTACGYIEGAVAQNSSSYLEHKQGIYKTKTLGTSFIPGVLKTHNKNGNFYTAFIPSFLHRDLMFQTEDDYTDACYQTLNLIKQYLYFRDMREQNARVVIVVEDNADLNNICDLILEAQSLNVDLERIYFTGEGAVKCAGVQNVKECFLQMKLSSDGTEYQLYNVIPDFM